MGDGRANVPPELENDIVFVYGMRGEGVDSGAPCGEECRTKLVLARVGSRQTGSVEKSELGWLESGKTRKLQRLGI